MAATIVQSVGIDGTGGTLTPSWPSATTTSNFLLAVVNVLTGNSVTTPSGWGSAITTQVSSQGGSSWFIYAIPNAASQSGTSSWTFPASSFPAVALIEISNFATLATVDVTTENGIASRASNSITINALGPTKFFDAAFLCMNIVGGSASSGITGSGWTYINQTLATGQNNTIVAWQPSLAANTTLSSEAVTWNGGTGTGAVDAFQFTLAQLGLIMPTSLGMNQAVHRASYW